MFVLGLTGGIGSGKSTAARLLERRGAVVVDCDAIGRSVYEPGGRAHDAVLARFGTVERPAIAKVVFRDPQALADLNAITHPAIDAEIAERIAAAAADAVVVLDMAVLVETHLGRGQYQAVLVVETPVDIRVERLLGRGMSEDDARSRIDNQATDDQRRAVADWVVHNGSDVEHLDRQLDALWAIFAERARAS